MSKNVFVISIHALREEGDLSLALISSLPETISIHALREEGDVRSLRPYSTPENFYPRPPRGGRRWRYTAEEPPKEISIHALREEGDRGYCFAVLPLAGFLSTPSARRATAPAPVITEEQHISIHALREEGDSTLPGWRKTERYFYPRPPRGGRRPARRSASMNTCYFYPRPPRGGRPAGTSDQAVVALFLSTPSARRATAAFSPSGRPQRYFYPRPPRGGRRAIHGGETFQWNFYPRPPRGGRPRLDVVVPDPADISIHALREEGDDPRHKGRARGSNFYPRPPRGGRPNYTKYARDFDEFLSTPSARRATIRITLRM